MVDTQSKQFQSSSETEFVEKFLVPKMKERMLGTAAEPRMAPEFLFYQNGDTKHPPCVQIGHWPEIPESMKIEHPPREVAELLIRAYTLGLEADAVMLSQCVELSTAQKCSHCNTTIDKATFEKMIDTYQTAPEESEGLTCPSCGKDFERELCLFILLFRKDERHPCGWIYRVIADADGLVRDFQCKSENTVCPTEGFENVDDFWDPMYISKWMYPHVANLVVSLQEAAGKKAEMWEKVVENTLEEDESFAFLEFDPEFLSYLRYFNKNRNNIASELSHRPWTPGNSNDKDL